MVDMQTHFFSGGQDLTEYLDHNEKPSLVKFLMEPNALETENEKIFQMLTSFFPMCSFSHLSTDDIRTKYGVSHMEHSEVRYVVYWLYGSCNTF